MPAGQVTSLRYVSTSGGVPAGQEFPVNADNVMELARTAQEGLVRLIAQFDSQDTPYRAVRRARFKYDYDDYAHLARVAEWLIDEGDEEVP
jgi:ATP-dependent helicase/nuclease subunit B